MRGVNTPHCTSHCHRWGAWLFLDEPYGRSKRTRGGWHWQSGYDLSKSRNHTRNQRERCIAGECMKQRDRGPIDMDTTGQTSVTTCLYCGALNMPGNKYCGQCAASLLEDRPHLPTTVLCGHCNMLTPADNKICAQCGTSPASTDEWHFESSPDCCTKGRASASEL